MNSFLAFFKKEWLENIRTYKVLILIILFLLLGMMNPLTAKLTPMLLENFMPEGVQLTLNEPTALDAWMQFYKNVPQIGLIVLVLVFSGMMSSEFSKGTLIPLLTKGLKRKTVLFSKFFMAVLLWSISFSLCFTVSEVYTIFMFPKMELHHLFIAALYFWLFGVLLLSILLLGNTLFLNHYGGLLLTGAFVCILFLINLIPDGAAFNPIMLVSDNVALLTKDCGLSDFIKPLLVTAALMIIFLTCAAAIFQKKQVYPKNG